MLIWPIVAYFLFAMVIIVGMVVVSAVLGQRHSERATGAPYEGGILSEGSAQVRFDAKFYLIGMFFVVFDLEAVFVYAWALEARDLGWWGYGEMAFFIVILVATLIYLWRQGALDWAPKGRRRKL